MGNYTPRGTPLVERIALGVDIDPESGCWLWRKSCTRDGYALIGVGGRTMSAHRVSYEEHVGPIPESYEIDHLCRVRHCVNPRHLRAVTHHENLLATGAQTITARNAAVTHCPRGHAYTEHGVRRHDLKRYCRACTRERGREKYADAARREAKLAGQRARYAANREAIRARKNEQARARRAARAERQFA